MKSGIEAWESAVSQYSRDRRGIYVLCNFDITLLQTGST